MGCCHSRQERRNKPSDVNPAVVNADSVVSTKSTAPTGLQACASHAGWVADSNFGNFVKTVEISHRVVFACLFDPHSTQDAATFCIERCQETFQMAMKKCNADPPRALERTLEMLDQQFLKSNLSPPVREIDAEHGAVLAYVDLEGKRCWIANTGTSECVIGVAEGAFNSKFMDGKTIAARHDSLDPAEQDSLKARFPEERESILKTTEGRTLMKGITKMTRCIGYGFAKDPKLTAVYNKNTTRPLMPLPDIRNPYILTKPHVEECDLSKGVEKIILCSEGMSQLLTPAEMAVFSMHFEKSNLAQLMEAHVPSEENRLSLGTPAVALVRYAVSKAAENFADAMNTFSQSFKTSPECYTSVQGYSPLQCRLGSGKERSFELVSVDDMRQMKVKQLAVRKSDIVKSTAFSRKDVHGNLSCVVISLDSIERSRRLFSQPSRSSSISPIVLYRWKLIQLFCKFHIQRRRACLRRWWKLIALVVRDAQQQLLDYEKATWFNKSNGTAHILLEPTSDTGENELLQKQASVFPSRLSSGFRKWLDTASNKGLGASMNEADVTAKVLCL